MYIILIKLFRPTKSLSCISDKKSTIKGRNNSSYACPWFINVNLIAVTTVPRVWADGDLRRF